MSGSKVLLCNQQFFRDVKCGWKFEKFLRAFVDIPTVHNKIGDLEDTDPRRYEQFTSRLEGASISMEDQEWLRDELPQLMKE